MALYWNLGVVTQTEEQAAACADFFSGRQLIVGGVPVRLEVSRGRGPDGWVVAVWPQGMSYGSPRGNDPRLTEEAARIEIAARFDAWLMDAPVFMAAYFGGEAVDRFLSEPISEIVGVDGLVVAEATWISLGRPVEAQPAGRGRYAWKRSRVP